VQRLAELRHRRHFPPPIVDEHDVHFVTRGGAGDEGRVNSHSLTGCASSQNAHLGYGVIVRRDQFLDASQNDMHRWHRRGETAVPLIRDHHHGAGFGDQRVRAGHAHAGGKENRANFVPGGVDLLGDVFERDLLGQHSIEEFADIFAAHVQRRPDDVARPLARELDDPLTKIGFDRFDPFIVESVIEVDLLADHRFRFGDR
jgi:hypothetical protein